MREKIKKAAGRMKNDLRRMGFLITAILLYLFVMNMLPGGICLIKRLTGIPCPGCGMTRAFFYLFTGNWLLSFRMHPLAIAWAAFALYLVIMRYWCGKRPKGILPILILLCTAMFGVYLYRMITIFPNREPMTYGSSGIIYHLLPFFGTR
ncbi:MAG: DUF2752 domain-containing protein [Lachnospiraceae bacterium]